jgi:hypothetical protein
MEVKDFIESRSIKRLCHFTKVANLPSILADGYIYATKELRGHAKTVYNDPSRADGHEDHVCCSIQYPNGYLLQKWTEAGEGSHEWAILCLDPAVMRRVAKFCPVNASTASGRHLQEGIDGLKKMFMKTPPSKFKQYRGPNHLPQCPTDLQAEVLVYGRIQWEKYVTGLVVSSVASKNEVEKILHESGSGVRVINNQRFFDVDAMRSAARGGPSLNLEES